MQSCVASRRILLVFFFGLVWLGQFWRNFYVWPRNETKMKSKPLQFRSDGALHSTEKCSFNCFSLDGKGQAIGKASMPIRVGRAAWGVEGNTT